MKNRTNGSKKSIDLMVGFGRFSTWTVDQIFDLRQFGRSLFEKKLKIPWKKPVKNTHFFQNRGKPSNFQRSFC